MATEEDQKPGIDERYQAATSTSNLRVEADKAGAGDVIIAAGMSDSRLGMALLRLHSEWDSSAKPRKISPDQIKALALTMRDSHGKPDMMRARRESAAWFASELRLFAQALKSRPAVIEGLTAWAAIKDIPAHAVPLAVLHWLHHTCQVCDGHGRRKVPDQPALGARQCHACDGFGQTHRPEGSTRLLTHIDYCIQQARNSLKRRLHRV